MADSLVPSAMVSMDWNSLLPLPLSSKCSGLHHLSWIHEFWVVIPILALLTWFDTPKLHQSDFQLVDCYSKLSNHYPNSARIFKFCFDPSPMKPLMKSFSAPMKLLPLSDLIILTFQRRPINLLKQTHDKGVCVHWIHNFNVYGPTSQANICERWCITWYFFWGDLPSFALQVCLLTSCKSHNDSHTPQYFR